VVSGGNEEKSDVLREKLRLLFDLEKCSVMHMRNRNEFSGEMDGKYAVEHLSQKERNLEKILQKSAKPTFCTRVQRLQGNVLKQEKG